MAYKTPFEKIYQNLLFTKTGGAWAYYKIEPRNINRGNKQELMQYKEVFRRTLNRLSAFKDVHLAMIPREIDLNYRFREVETSYDEKNRLLGIYYHNRAQDVLESELGAITEPTVYLGIPIKNGLTAKEDKILHKISKQFNQTILNLFGIIDISQEQLETGAINEKEAREALASLKARPLTEKELRYFCRYNFIRGLKHDYSIQAERKKSVSDTLLDTATYPRYIVFDDGKNESVGTFLPIESTQKDLTNVDIFSVAQQFDFDVEVQMKLTRYAKQAIDRKISFTRTRFKETEKEISYRDDELTYGKEELDDLKGELSNQNAPFWGWIACLVVTGKDYEQCKERATIVKQHFENAYNVEMTQPIADQLTLFYKYLPTEKFRLVGENWCQYSLSDAISEMEFAVSKRAGNIFGDYIGRITEISSISGNSDELKQLISSSRFLVFVDFLIANEGVRGAMTDSLHFSVTGQIGKGKSFLTKLIFMNLLFKKCKILMIDPKTEVQEWFAKALRNEELCQKYPEFVQLMAQIHYVTLDANKTENKGVLDPLVFLKGTDAKDTCMTLLKQVFPIADIKIENEINRILAELLVRKEQGEKVGLRLMWDEMEASETEQFHDFGVYMRGKIEGSILELSFSDGQTEGLQLDAKATILQIQGLKLPSAETASDQLTEKDKASISLMVSLEKFCENFGIENRNEKTSIIFDEAWTLTKSRSGKELIDSLLRVGRSYNAQVGLITQSVSDVDEDSIKSNIGMSFCFDSPRERPQILDYLGLEQNEENLNSLANMIKGQCYFKDIYNSVVPLSIDCLYEEWTEAFKTTEQHENTILENAYR